MKRYETNTLKGYKVIEEARVYSRDFLYEIVNINGTEYVKVYMH
jgi:hypothetical protein